MDDGDTIGASGSKTTELDMNSHSSERNESCSSSCSRRVELLKKERSGSGPAESPRLLYLMGCGGEWGGESDRESSAVTAPGSSIDSNEDDLSD